MYTKNTGNYNIIYAKKNMGESEKVIHTDIRNIIVPDEHPFEQPKLMEKN